MDVLHVKPPNGQFLCQHPKVQSGPETGSSRRVGEGSAAGASFKAPIAQLGDVHFNGGFNWKKNIYKWCNSCG